MRGGPRSGEGSSLNLVPALPAALAAPFLLLVPGLALLALLPARDRATLPLDEAAFLAVATSVAASAWVGILLAELGRFSLLLAAAVLGGLSLVAVLAGRRRLGRPFAAPRGPRELLPALCVLGLALALQARPSQYVVGGRDPGAYVAAMGLIARTGGIAYLDPVVLSIPAEGVELFFRHPENAPFSWSRFMGFDLESPASGRVFPQFFHLFPVFGAYLFQAMGVKGALATPPLLAVLGTLAVFFTLRRLAGPAPALLGAALLGLNQVQVFFARYPVSENFSQLLLFLGTLLLLHWEERGSPALAATAGAALGLSLLVRVDGVLIVVPLAIYVLARRSGGELGWGALAPLLASFALLAAHAALHAQLFAAKYVHDIASRPYWRQTPQGWAGLGLLAALTVVAAHRAGPLLRAFASQRRGGLRSALIAALALLAAYAYALRPQLSAWAGGDGNAPALWRTSFGALDRDGDGALSPAEFARRRASGEPGELARLDRDHDGRLARDEWKGDPPWPLGALGFQRLAAHDAQSLVRLGWFVSPLGLLLGLLGLIVVLRRPEPRFLFPVLTALVFSLFYLYKVRVWNDYYFALRRYLPVTLPYLLGFAALFVTRLARRGGAGRLAAGVLALALAGCYASDTRRIASHVEWRSSVDFVRDLARRFGPNDLVVFEQPRSIHLLSLPLWALHGVNVLELARFDPDPEALRRTVLEWRRRYRDVYFVHTYRTDLCGMFLQRLEEHGFPTVEWERTYDRPPRRAEARALHFTISRVVPPDELQVPALPEVDVGGSDDFQVSGFFDKEGGGDRTYRWSSPCASLYLPGARPGASLVLVAAVGERPAASPARLRLSLSGVPLGEVRVGPGWADHRVALPDPLPPGPPVLRLDVPGWRPASVLAGSRDTRDLGVMLDRVLIEAGAQARVSIAPPARAGGAR